jgi:Uncharacterised protein family UPF0547
MASSGYWEERWKQRQEPRDGRWAASKAVPQNPLGLGLVLVGAAALAISVFLPFVQPVSASRMVKDNTLIQQAGGWMFVLAALLIATWGYQVGRGSPKKRWVPLMLSAIALALVVITANDKDARTLYPSGPDGTIDTSQSGVVASLGIAIYVAGAGVAAALIGSLMLLQTAKQRAPDTLVTASGTSATKKCPDCAETILVDAKVCKHCGYRFAPAG